MRNILKGFLEPKAETYVLPNTDDIRMDGEEEFIPLVPEEEEEPEEVLPPVHGELVTVAYSSRRFISDVSEYTPYYQDILDLYRKGVSTGSDASGSFLPGEPITRGALAAMLGIDLVFAIGSGELAGKTADGVALSGGSVLYFPTKEEALPELRRQLEPGTVMLVKASHAMKFGWLVERLQETQTGE